jgi:hypothetical protein
MRFRLFRHIAAMLQENASLESFSIQVWNLKDKIKANDYFDFVTALQNNTTLKSLTFGGCEITVLTHDEDKQTAALLKKNYALEELPNIEVAREVHAILRLNAAGRRYLIEDGSSISKGVEVLSKVNNDIDCAFVHLLENPRLCDRSAVEIVTAGGGKRE